MMLILRESTFKSSKGKRKDVGLTYVVNNGRATVKAAQEKKMAWPLPSAPVWCEMRKRVARPRLRSDRRAKQHQLGIKENVKSCTQTPEDVNLILQEHEDKKLTAKKPMSGEVHEDDDEALRTLDISRIRSGKRPNEEESMPFAKKNRKDPLDVIYYRKPEETLKKGK
ncbi:hypothetical protein KIW84_043592 [Lathyrus oleraceus]|uniref:Uncharacterized protein n=1 Tax=Pisum sativum TaxID=3888 RepID=A0A9D4XIR0_PEA|nr:hypothetical protein KIW84_043592 [Pisum sativum]